MALGSKVPLNPWLHRISSQGVILDVGNTASKLVNLDFHDVETGEMRLSDFAQHTQRVQVLSQRTESGEKTTCASHQTYPGKGEPKMLLNKEAFYPFGSLLNSFTPKENDISLIVKRSSIVQRPLDPNHSWCPNLYPSY